MNVDEFNHLTMKWYRVKIRLFMTWHHLEWHIPCQPFVELYVVPVCTIHLHYSMFRCVEHFPRSLMAGQQKPTHIQFWNYDTNIMYVWSSSLSILPFEMFEFGFCLSSLTEGFSEMDLCDFYLLCCWTFIVYLVYFELGGKICVLINFINKNCFSFLSQRRMQYGRAPPKRRCLNSAIKQQQ